MNTSESFRALQRAKRRADAKTVEAVRAELLDLRAPLPRRRRALPIAAAAILTALGVAVAVVLISSRGAAVEDATAAVQRAAEVTAASAERSGTAVVRINRDGQLWAGSTIRWNGADLAVTQVDRERRLLVVGGMMYGVEPGRGWVEMGPPSSVDPGSGTTPAEYLAAVQEDVGGATLRRITEGTTAATTRQLEDGSIVYSGKVAATAIARETGFKEGRAIRVLPFGYVAHELTLQVDLAITFDDVVRKLEVTWGSWSYTVSYSKLGATPALVAPRNAEPLRRATARRRG